MKFSVVFLFVVLPCVWTGKWTSEKLPTPSDFGGIEPITWAVMSKDIDLMQRLFLDGNGITKASLDSSLIFAVDTGDVKILELLVKNGADVNARDSIQKTLLQYVGGNIEMATFLIQNGADVNAVDKFGRTPLHSATESHHEDMVDFLIEHGSNINAANGDKDTPLHLASQYGNVPMVKLLLKKDGINVNAVNKDGRTPLHDAVCESTLSLFPGKMETIKLLLENGADRNLLDNDGKTALSCTYTRYNLFHNEDYKKMAEMLKENE